MLHDCDGIDKNIEKAARYFKMAADKGHNNGMNCYGIMLYNTMVMKLILIKKKKLVISKCLPTPMKVLIIMPIRCGMAKELKLTKKEQLVIAESN